MRLKDALDAVLALRGRDRPDDALALCEEILAQVPTSAAARHILGVLKFERGECERGIAEVTRAAHQDPANAEIRNSLGICQVRMNRPERAITSFREALARAPDMVEAHFNLGALLLGDGEATAAVEHLHQVVKACPDHIEASVSLAQALAQAGRPDAALEHLNCVLGREPACARARDALIAIARDHPEAALPAWLDDVILAWLEDGATDPREFAELAWRVVVRRHSTAFAQLRETEFDPALSETGADACVGGLLDAPLFRAMLAGCPVSRIADEQALVALRRAALLEIAAKSELPEGSLDWLVPLALHMHAAGYVYPVGPDEAKAVAELRADAEHVLAREGGPGPGAPVLAVLALYEPLHRLAGARHLPARTRAAAPALGHLIDETVSRCIAEQQIGVEIPTLGAITDWTSRQVRTQYEELPYPRWRAISRQPAQPLAEILRKHLPFVELDPALSGPVDVLVAGCGTGWEVAEAATAYASAQVLGLDLSRSSLAYGAGRAGEMGLPNASFVHGDILEAHRLGARFDYIQCGGALHHMADPLAGWAALVRCLRPHGVMKVALYSHAGRAAIRETRAVIAAQGFGAGVEDIRAFRAVVAAAEPGSALAGIAGYTDFFYLAGCRDLVFHEHEHQLDLPWIEDAMALLGLEFLGFHIPDAAIWRLYRERFPEDRTAVRLGNWESLEAETPHAFRSMYQFWCRLDPNRSPASRSVDACVAGKG